MVNSNMEIINIDNSFNLEKLIIDNNSHIKINFKETEKKIDIIIKDNINVKIFCKSNKTKNTINYFVGENSSLIVDKFVVNSSDSITINLDGKQAKVQYNSGVINSSDNIYNQRVNHNVENTESKVVNHALSLSDNTFKFIIDGVIKKEASNSILNQDNKIINLNSGKSFIEPNLIIDNEEVEANHSAFIGSFNEDNKFYLMSRGIKEKETYDLLIKSFLLNEMTLNKEDCEDILSIIEKEKDGYRE